MSAIGLIGILVAMVLFLVMVYKNCVSYWVAILCAIIVALTNELDILSALFTLGGEQSSFLQGMVDLLPTMFKVVFMGAIIGKLYTDSGAVTSIANAQANAQANRLPATYRCARTEALLDSLPHDADLWIVDPPRAGLAPAVRERLLRLRPRRILYVSCGPDTLARDLAALTPAYAIDAIRLVDFFPRTPHFETLTLLSAN